MQVSKCCHDNSVETSHFRTGSGVAPLDVTLKAVFLDSVFFICSPDSMQSFKHYVIEKGGAHLRVNVCTMEGEASLAKGGCANLTRR